VTRPAVEQLPQLAGHGASANLISFQCGLPLRHLVAPSYMCRKSRGPVPAKQLRLFEHGLRRLLLLVRRVAVLTEEAADDGAHLGASALFHGAEDQSLSIQIF